MRCAIFDVDETIIKIKSMFSFYQYLSQSTQMISNIRYEEMCNQVNKMKLTCDRSEINKFYYACFSGFTVEQLRECGKQWYASLTKNIFYEKTMSLLNDYKQKGYQIILVSGSHPFCLEPLNMDIKADALVCAKLVGRDGVLTGELKGQPVIGDGKVTALQQFTQTNQLDIDWQNSVAFADDDSDIPMLKLVGNGFLIKNGSDIRRV